MKRVPGRVTKFIMPLSLAATLCDCTYVAEKANQLTNQNTPTTPGYDIVLDPVSKSVYDHYYKSFADCQNKERAILTANTGLNAGSDFFALLYSTIASVISPIQTAHLFSAASSVTVGLKTTVATDVTTAALTNMSIAFDKIYFEPMLDLSKSMESGVTQKNAASFHAKIDNLDHNCSLYEANVYVVKNLTTSSAKPATPDVSINSAPARVPAPAPVPAPAHVPAPASPPTPTPTPTH